jgi:hypothetical protein
VALLRKLFGGGQSVPFFPVHPDDEALVGEADVAWWRGVTLWELKKYERNDTASRVVLVRSHMKYGQATKEAAEAKAMRALPSFYGTIEQREAGLGDLDPDDAPLPWILRKRVDDAIVIGEVRQAELSRSSSMNALIRRLIRDGKI